MNKNEFLKVFGERARILRLSKRITQKELSQMSSVSVVTISSYESKNATKMPSALTVVRIAQALGVSLDYLCGVDEKEKTAGEMRRLNVQPEEKVIVLGASRST